MLQNLERYQIIKPSEVTKISTALSLLAPLSLELLEYHGIPNHSSLTHHKSAWGRIQSRILMMWQYHTIPASFHVWWEGSYDPKQIKALLASWQCHHKNKKLFEFHIYHIWIQEHALDLFPFLHAQMLEMLDVAISDDKTWLKWERTIMEGDHEVLYQSKVIWRWHQLPISCSRKTHSGT